MKCITLDHRRRCSLAGVGKKEHTLYMATSDEAGVILLVPAKIVPINPMQEKPE